MFIFNSYMLYSEKELNNSKNPHDINGKEERKKSSSIFLAHERFVYFYILHISQSSLAFFLLYKRWKCSRLDSTFFYVRSYTFYKLNNKKKGTAESLYTFMLIYMYGTVRHEEEYKAHSLCTVHCYAMWCDVFLWEPRNIKKKMKGKTAAKKS